MNTHELNATVLGNGTPTANTYWFAAAQVAAIGVGVFTSSGLVAVFGSAAVSAVGVGLLGAKYSVGGTTSPEANLRIIMTPLIRAYGAAVAVAESVGKFTSGVASAVYASASAYAVGKWVTSAEIAWAGVGSAVATVKGVPGLLAKVYGNSVPAVSFTSAFTNFGEYAPDERFIIVPQEDRKVTVA